MKAEAYKAAEPHRRPAVDGYQGKEGTGARACAGYLPRSDGCLTAV